MASHSSLLAWRIPRAKVQLRRQYQISHEVQRGAQTASRVVHPTHHSPQSPWTQTDWGLLESLALKVLGENLSEGNLGVALESLQGRRDLT